MRRVSFLVFSESSHIRARVSDALSGTGRVKVEAAIDDVSVLEETLSELPDEFDAIYIDVDAHVGASRLLEIIEKLPEPRPDVCFGGQENDPDILLRAMRLGARDFFVDHQLDEIDKLIEGITPQRSGSRRSAPILAVTGAKGGVGATSIACELAVQLQESGKRVVVCDLSLRLGDVALYFDLQHPYTLADICKKDGPLDATFVEAVLIRHSTGVSVLSAPTNFEDLTVVTFSHLERVLNFFRDEFDCIILDVPWGFDEFSLRSLDTSDQILLVTTPDVPSLTHTRERLGLLQKLTTREERAHVVLNRHSRSASIDVQEMGKFLQCNIDATIPEESAVAQQCTNEGLLLHDVKGSERMVQSIRSLSDRVYEWCRLERPGDEMEVDDSNLVSRLRKLVGRR